MDISRSAHGFAAGLKHLVSRRGRGWVLYSHPRSKSFMCATAGESNQTKAFRCFKTYMNMNHSNVNHLESRWRNSHVSVYHGPLRIATFWELRHLLSIRWFFWIASRNCFEACLDLAGHILSFPQTNLVSYVYIIYKIYKLFFQETIPRQEPGLILASNGPLRVMSPLETALFSGISGGRMTWGWNPLISLLLGVQLPLPQQKP